MCKVFKLKLYSFDLSKALLIILLYFVSTNVGLPLKDIIETF